MKSLTTKTKTAATIATFLVILSSAGLAHGANAREVVATDPNLVVRVVQLGEVQGFWAVNCPIALTNATAWAQGDINEATALHREGFAIGLREMLRSTTGAIGASVALRFRSAAGATADLDRREQLAGRAGYATNFAVAGSSAAHAYTVRTADATTVRVVFTRGADEYAIVAVAAKGADIGALQRALAGAVARVARRR
jgi:hypothetical protein